MAAETADLEKPCGQLPACRLLSGKELPLSLACEDEAPASAKGLRREVATSLGVRSWQVQLLKSDDGLLLEDADSILGVSEVQAVVLPLQAQYALVSKGGLGSGTAELELFDLIEKRCSAKLLQRLPRGFAVVSADYDKQFAAVGQMDGVLHLFDLHSASSLASCRAHASSIHAVDLSVAAGRIVTGSRDCCVKVWAYGSRTLTCMGTLRGHVGCIYALTFCAAQSRVISGSDDGTLRVWDLSDDDRRAEEPLRADAALCRGVLCGHEFGVRALQVDADAGNAVSIAEDGAICMWDLQRMQRVAKYCAAQHEEAGRGVAFSRLAVDFEAMRSVACSVTNCSLYMFDLDGLRLLGTVQFHIPCSPLVELKVNFATSRAIACGIDGALTVVDLATLKVVSSGPVVSTAAAAAAGAEEAATAESRRMVLSANLSLFDLES